MSESEDGIDIPALKAYHKKKGTITGFPGAKTVRIFLLVMLPLAGLPVEQFCNRPESALIEPERSLQYHLTYFLRVCRRNLPQEFWNFPVMC